MEILKARFALDAGPDVPETFFWAKVSAYSVGNNLSSFRGGNETFAVISDAVSAAFGCVH
jgi:hypothetical protein